MSDIEVEAPDGSIHEFPDGTKPDVIKKVMADYVKSKRSKYASSQDEQRGNARWDIGQDIGRAFTGAKDALKQDVSDAFPSADETRARLAKESEDRAAKNKNRSLTDMLLAPFGGGELGNMLSSPSTTAMAKIPLDVMGIAASPFMGTVNALGGSALSYLPGVDKTAADEIVDKSLMAMAPEGMEGGISGIESANAMRDLTKTATRQADTKAKAAEVINKRAAADKVTAQDVLDAQSTANADGDKVTLMDMGKNLRGLAGSVRRRPGEAGADIDEFLDKRDKAMTDAITADIQGSVAKGSAYKATQDLFKARTAASKPAYEAAAESTSIAPFESQYRQGVIESTSKKAQAAKQIKDIEQNNSGALASRGAAGKEVRDKYMDLRTEMENAEADRQAYMAMFKRAQADGTANAPGAVWSPKLQTFMSDPEVKAGLRQGLLNAKREALGKGIPFKDSDYAIVGWGDDGLPVVGEVPTMKSLMVAKETVDGRILELKDPVTGRPTKAGVALKIFQRGEDGKGGFVGELMRLNPRYKPALDSWSGPSSSLDALREGKEHFSRTESTDEVKADFDALSPSDKEFYRLGAAQRKIDQLERAPRNSDKSKRVINSDSDQKRFEMLFDKPEYAQKFVDSIERKREMFDTRTSVKGGPQTAERIAEDESILDHPAVAVGKAAVQAKTGNFLGAIRSALQAKRDLGMRNNPDLNLEISRYLTDPSLKVDPAAGNALLSINKTTLRSEALASAIKNRLAGLNKPNLPQPPGRGGVAPVLAVGNALRSIGNPVPTLGQGSGPPGAPPMAQPGAIAPPQVPQGNPQ